MAKNDDKQRGEGSGTGAVLLIVCLLIIVSFIGDDHPMDRLADIIMIITWIMAIGFLVSVCLFAFAYYFQTAINDFYEAILEDMEHSRLKEKMIEFRVFLEKHVFNSLKNKSANLTDDGTAAENQERPRSLMDKIDEVSTSFKKRISGKSNKEKKHDEKQEFDAYEEEMLEELQRKNEREDNR